MNNDSSLELRVERYKNARNAAFEKLQRFQNEVSVSKRYVDGALQVKYSFWVGGTQVRMNIRRREDEVGLDDNRFFHAAVHNREMPMLVWVGNLAQGFHPTASLVRLQVLDSSNLAIRKAVQICPPARVEAVLTIFGKLAVLDGELSPILAPREFVNKVIECCPQIVDDLANYDGNVFRDFVAGAVVDAKDGLGSGLEKGSMT